MCYLKFVDVEEEIKRSFLSDFYRDAHDFYPVFAYYDLLVYFQSLLRTAEQLKIKGLCEVSEPQYEQDFSPSVKRYKPYSSRSPDSRHPPPPSGSQPLSNTRNAHSSSSQINNNQSGQDSKSGHNSSSSGRNHNSNLETVVSDDGSSPIVVLESHDLTSTPGKEGKTKMTSLGMGVGIVSKISNDYSLIS